jgi:hypothetical protein
MKALKDCKYIFHIKKYKYKDEFYHGFTISSEDVIRFPYASFPFKHWKYKKCLEKKIHKFCKINGITDYSIEGM